MMTNLTEKIIHRFLRCCYSCGELGVTTESYILCQHCADVVSQKQLIFERRKDWASYSLLSWQDDCAGVGRLIHSLKGAGAEKKFSYLAKLLARQIYLEFAGSLSIQEKVIFVPAPARNISERDHAGLLAESLARNLGGEVRFVLKRESVEEQKGLNLASRKKARLTI